MALAPLRIPTLSGAQPIVDRDGRPTAEFLRRINDALKGTTELLNRIAALPEIQAQLGALDQTVADAQVAIAAAQDAAIVAQDAAAGAQAAADGAQEAVVIVQEATIAAQTAADGANAAIEQIADGTLALEAVTIGGQRFINQGGTLTVEP